MTAMFACLSLLTALSTPFAGEDWPWWNGPERNGISREVDWSVEGKPDPLWRVQVGLGYSAVAVQAGRVFTIGYDPEKELDTVFAFDEASGRPLWTHSYPSKIWKTSHGGGSLATPAADGDVVYTSEREGELLCLRAASGDVVWRVQVAKDLGIQPPAWGFAVSPLVFDDRLILNYGHVVALDKHTGKELWRSERHFGDAYSTPIDFAPRGTHALAAFDQLGLGVVALEDGRELAFVPWKGAGPDKCVSMTPVAIGSRIFVSAPQGAMLIDFDGEEPDKLWSKSVMKNQETGCVLWEDHLYGFDLDVLKCIDLAGNEVWRQRGIGAGALTIASGRLLIVSSEGELIIAQATPEAFTELYRRQALDPEGAPFWTLPVLANGRIYLRSHAGELVALDHRTAGASTGDGESPPASDAPASDRPEQKSAENE